MFEEGKVWRIPMFQFHSVVMTKYYIQKQLRGERLTLALSSQLQFIVWRNHGSRN